MAKAAKLSNDLVIEQGATYQKRFTWKTGEPASPVDLTGWIGRMQIRETVESTTVVFELTTANGRMTLGGAAGTIDLEIDATDTENLGPWEDKHVWDLELEDPSGFVRRLVEGKVQLSLEVTR